MNAVKKKRIGNSGSPITSDVVYLPVGGGGGRRKEVKRSRKTEGKVNSLMSYEKLRIGTGMILGAEGE